MIVCSTAIIISSCNSSSGGGTNLSSQPPDGVNFGGMYVLEDWLSSSDKVDHYVSTPCQYKNTGIANSNIFAQDPHIKNFTWTSETNLTEKFLQNGYTEEQVAELFQQHRDTYLLQEKDGPGSIDANFAKLQSLGIKFIRLPVTWAITYPDHSYTINPGNGGTPVVIPATNKVVLITDPFYPNVKWASIPIMQIETILQIASWHGIKVLIDIHAYPGGSGDGTYNGVWPNPPRFWTTGVNANGKPIYQKNFQTIVQNLIIWADGLFKLDDQSYANGLAGLSPMNEPAHLMGIPDARCDSKTSWGITSYQDVLNTLALSVNDFKQSSLPSHNIKLYMNVIETMFPNGINTYKTIGTWWNGITSEEERDNWAMLDIHHYIAWDANCNQCIMNDVVDNKITSEGFAKAKMCSSWFLNLRQNLDLSEKSLLSTSEISASTNSDTDLSCASGRTALPYKTPDNYAEYRNYFLEEQIANAKKANIQTYFWNWMIPYNKNYQNEWSLYNICTGANPPAFCNYAINLMQ